ncbi:MAG: amidohydrolase family protein [Deltaproteobacteria bacterium]|nr:amidohydrolase family protein [Deltaproteobacteria bacterium]
MIFDAHTHIFPEEVCRGRENFFADEPAFRLLYGDPKSRLISPAEMIAALAEEGVDAAVVSGFPWRTERLLRRHHEVLLEAMRRWPDKLIAFCTVNPLEPGAAREVERCLAAGFRGVGELAWYADVPSEKLEELAPIAELCQHFKVPLMLHTNDPVGAQYPGKAAMSLPAVYNLIRQFPEVTWILAHWGGGLPFYGLQKKETPQVYKNVYFDTAASPYLYRPAIYRLAAEMVGPEKILFGSDYPLLPPSRYVKEMDEADLPTDWREMILGKNLTRVLNL